MRKIFLLLLSAVFLNACGTHEKKTPLLKTGGWKGALTLDDSTGLVIPFRFEVTFDNDSTRWTIHNAEESIPVDEISFSGDSVFIRMPVFDSEFRCKRLGDSLLTGNWINHARTEKNIIPFMAMYGDSDVFGCPHFDENFPYEGRWRCVFSPNEPDSSYAIGVFHQQGDKATGTFLTETGDYRYLEGCVFGKYMLLYCFDGSHAFAFHAEIMPDDSMIWGEFYSGIHHHETWLGWKDDTFRLRNADSLTFMKPGSSKVEFSFKDLDGKSVSLNDEKYRNKVVVLQIMGSWCPNCMDETAFLTGLHNKYQSQGLEVIGLCFEKTDDFAKAASNVNRLKKRFNSSYDFLITGFQPKDAGKALPMLNHVMSFPTTIFIDRDGMVRKIRTGYSGPATGEEYRKFEGEINSFVENLLKH